MASVGGSQMAITCPIIVSKHAITRYVQRIIKKFENDDRKAEEIGLKRKKEIMGAVVALVKQGKEDKSFLNDSQFMAYLWEKYGDEKPHLVRNGKVLIVMMEQQTATKTILVVKTIIEGESPREYFNEKMAWYRMHGFDATCKFRKAKAETTSQVPKSESLPNAAVPAGSSS